MKKCAKCDFEYDDAYDGCPRCAQRVEDQPVAKTVAVNWRMILGLGGVALIFLGVFMPIASLPVVGSVNYFDNGKGDGVILIALALISALLIAVKLYRGLLATGGASAAMLAYSFFALTEAQASLESSLAGNPFAGLAQSVQIQWGWAVLVLGALLLLAAGMMNETHPAARPAARQRTVEPPVALGVLSEGAKLAGRAVYYTGGVFSVEGAGPVGQQFVKMHHARGQIAWSTPQTHAWAVTHFGPTMTRFRYLLGQIGASTGETDERIGDMTVEGQEILRTKYGKKVSLLFLMEQASKEVASGATDDYSRAITDVVARLGTEQTTH